MWLAQLPGKLLLGTAEAECEQALPNAAQRHSCHMEQGPPLTTPASAPALQTSGLPWDLEGPE